PVSGDLILGDADTNFYSQVYVYNDVGLLVGQGYIGFGSTLSVPVVAGSTYYVSLNEYFNNNTGDYSLTIATDVGNTRATARDLTLAADGSGMQAGQFETTDDVDYYRITATASGGLTVSDLD